jgi:sensor domain CHASE-containing protein
MTLWVQTWYEFYVFYLFVHKLLLLLLLVVVVVVVVVVGLNIIRSSFWSVEDKDIQDNGACSVRLETGA